MKIAHLVCVYPPYKGGMGNVAYQYSENLKKLGQDVYVHTPLYSKANNRTKDEKVFYEKPLLSLGNGAFLPQILRKLNNYDIVHLHYPFFGTAELVWLQKFLYRTNYKLVLHYHMDTSGLSKKVRLLSWPAKIIEPWLFDQASAVTCASLDYIEHSSIGKYYFGHKNKFFEIPFGVDPTEFTPNWPNKNTDKQQIFFIANLDKAHYFKGLDVLFEAFSKIKNKKATLNIGGDGELKKPYQLKCRGLGIDDKVKFLGKLNKNDLIKNFQGSSFTVLPSVNSHEAFGLVLLESMACGTPVIASDLPGVRSVFKNGIHGLKFKAGDPNDLAKKIDIMFNDMDLVKMGERGVALVKEKYSWSISATRLIEIYKNILV